MLKSKKILANLITAACITSPVATATQFYNSTDNKYLSLSAYTGLMQHDDFYGDEMFSEEATGAEIFVGVKVLEELFVEGGLSYGLQATQSDIKATYIPGPIHAGWGNSKLTFISRTRISRTSLGLKSNIYNMPRMNFSFIVGGGISYTNIDASWDAMDIKSCSFNKTGMTPYLKTGFEYKFANNMYLGLTYTYVYLASLGTMTAQYQDDIHYQNNNQPISPMIRAKDLQIFGLNYIVTF